MVQVLLFECYRCMDSNGLTIEDIFDVIDAKSLVGNGMLDSVIEHRKAEVLFETDELLSAFADIALVFGEFFKKLFDRLTQAHQKGDFFRYLVWLPVFDCLHSMRFEFDTLVLLPAALVRGHPFFIVVELDRMVVGLEDDLLSDQPRRGRIGVGIEGDTEVLMNLEGANVPAIGKLLRQCSQAKGFKAQDGSFAGCTMNAHIGNFIAPPIGLMLQIIEILGRSKRPEVLFNIAYTSSFDLAFFMGSTHMAGLGDDMKGAQEIQEGIVESNQRPIPLDDGSKHVVGDDLFGGSPKEAECIDKTLVDTCLILAVGKLQIQHPAVAFADGHAIDFSADIAIAEAPKLSPVDLELLTRLGFETNICPWGFGPNGFEMFVEDALFAAVSGFEQLLTDDLDTEFGILLEQGIDTVPKGIQFAWSAVG